MRRTPRAAVGGALLAAALAMAGCGGAPDPTPSPSSPVDVRTGRDPSTPFTVSQADLGIHSFSTRPDVPTGSLRLNCFPTWSAVNPNPGEFDWAEFDRVVAEAEDWGYQDIVYVFCSTPAWAGEPVTGPDEAVFGPGTAQPPADMASYTDFVRAVAQRYKDRITGYEVWNEPSSPQFFTGTPQQMGAMTQAAHDVVAEVDPAAYVLSAGFQTHLPDIYDEFIPEYLSDLQERGWPIDAVSAHFYPVMEGTPQTRVHQIEQVQHDLDRFGAPSDIALWDTEVNYNVNAPGGAPQGRISGAQAAAWTAQTYLEGWRLGVRRTFWYLWTADYYGFPGIQMRPGDPATRALQTLGQWVIGAEFEGCDTTEDAPLCRFRGSDGTEFRIGWSNARGGTTVPLDAVSQVCPVDGSPCQSHSGDVALTPMPVRIG